MWTFPKRRQHHARFCGADRELAYIKLVLYPGSSVRMPKLALPGIEILDDAWNLPVMLVMLCLK